MTDQIPVLIGGVDHLQTDFNYSMAELRSLAQAADFKVIQQVHQRLPQVNNKTYFGPGKVQQIQHLAATHAIQTVIVNDELTPAQLRNLERSTQLYFLDRTELILQIFQKRAHSQQAQLQVAIAQLQYQLPRIHPSQNPLDQQRGGQGINNRGAGESQLELKQRQLRQRITQLQNKLQHTKQALTTQSERRQQQHLPQVALVGYTNAGKSTTFNQILAAVPHSKVSPVLVQDQLFATLDTTIRRIDVPQLPTFLLSDTIGFISQLPTTLIAAFRSTLQEAQTADLLIQVIDATHPQKETMIATTQQILTELGIAQKPMIYAYNKADQFPATAIPQISGPTIYYSAYQKKSIQALLHLIGQQLFRNYRSLKLLIPFNEYQIISYLEHQVFIQNRSYHATGILYQVLVQPADLPRLRPFIIEKT